MATVDLIQVNKYYLKKLILSDINLKIQEGEFVAVVGPSGCGKSTLLRLVAGLEKVSSGEVLINNQCVNQIPPAKRDIAMVFQNYALYPHMTVFDNMAYALKMRGMKTKEIQEKVFEVAGMLQLTEYLTSKPQMLSGGQKQRVAMGRAIVRSPSVFLFDEPLSNLDAKLRTSMRHEIKKLHRELGTTCLYVTHDQIEAMTMASKVLVLNEGKVEQIGSPGELYSRPASLFVAGFLGHHPINLIPGYVDSDHHKIHSKFGLEFMLPPVLVDTSISLPQGSEVLIGVRAEHFVLAEEEGSESILVDVEFIDNIGSDNLLHAVTPCGEVRFSVRVSSETEVNVGPVRIKPVIKYANLFDKKTGLRLGGWHESKSS